MGANENFAKLPHIGEAVRRKEDYRFLTGSGQYTDDINLPNQRHAVFVRSPHAHAAIRSIDTTQAAAMPGVRLDHTPRPPATLPMKTGRRRLGRLRLDPANALGPVAANVR